MAYRLASKINRFLSPNKFQIPRDRLQSTFSKQESQQKNVQHKVRSIKSFTHETQAGKCALKEKDVPFPMKGRDHNAEMVAANLSNVQKEQPTAVITPINDKDNLDDQPPIANNTPSYPEEYEPLPPKRFERSSTQNAITGPLKMPRLANPFPEPVKIMMSHETLSDQEKADLMLEEAKMEQRFYEQQKYEAQKRQTETQSVKNEVKGTSGYRRITGSRSFSSFANIFPKNAPNQVEQCEKIINALKGQYPESEIPRKTMWCEAGSPEEKQFIKNTMKFLARHKRNQKNTKTAPFPSYSEVKTYAREAKNHKKKSIEEIEKAMTLTEVQTPVVTDMAVGKPIKSVSRKCSTMDNVPLAFASLSRRKMASVASVQNMIGVRSYSERPNKCDMKPKKDAPVCPTLVMKGCKRPNREGCLRENPPPPCRKQLAPYPSYSECMDPPFAEDPTECTQCPWPGEVSYDKIGGEGKKCYSTMSQIQQLRASKSRADSCQARCYSSTPPAPVPLLASPRPPKQCKRPKQQFPPCDYKKTAAKRTDKRIRKLYRPPKKHRYSTSATVSKESADVITKVREWLNAWRPDHENIRITARRRPAGGSEANAATREAYEIEIVEKKERVQAQQQQQQGQTVPRSGAMASDLPAFVSEISNMSQGERPVIEIREDQQGSTVLCSGKKPIPMEAQKGGNLGSCDVCGSPGVKHKICKVTDGGCIKKKKKPPRKKCRGPIKRPLPACEKDDCRGFSKINEDVDPSITYNNEKTPSVSVNNIFKKHDYYETPKTITYNEDAYAEHEYRRKRPVNIDNAAQILNVAMPRDGHEESPPMKLKPQFWSKFTKTTTLPIKGTEI